MSSLIPVSIAELAVENLNNQINELQEKIKEIKVAGAILSMQIHKSKTFEEFYPQLAEFEKLIESHSCDNRSNNRTCGKSLSR